MRLVLNSVTVEIHRQIGALKRQGLKPAKIHLCRVCSVRFAYEQNRRNPNINQAPRAYLGLPIVYRSPRIAAGVWVEPVSPSVPPSS